MSTEVPPAATPPDSQRTRRPNLEEFVRAVCAAVGMIGFFVGIILAILNLFADYTFESRELLVLKGMFMAFTPMCMGVLIPNPRVRVFVWLVVVPYACWLLRELLAAGR